MKWFAIVWIVVGAALVAAAVFILLTHAAGPASRTLARTFGRIGIPFLGFGLWGLYAELQPCNYERRPPQRQRPATPEPHLNPIRLEIVRHASRCYAPWREDGELRAAS